MTAPTPTEMVSAIAREHPGRHPYTLSLLLQVRYDRTISGRWRGYWLSEPLSRQGHKGYAYPIPQPARLHDTRSPTAPARGSTAIRAALVRCGGSIQTSSQA